MEGLTTEQFETVLRFCDLLDIEDFSTGVLLLKQTNWNLEKAMGFEQSSHSEKNRLDKGGIYTSQYEDMKNMGQEKYKDQLMNYQQKEIEDQAHQFQYQYDYYQNQFNRMEDVRKNQQLQNEGFEKKILDKKSQNKGKTKINEQLPQQYKDCETSKFEKSNLIYEQNLEYLQMERQFQIKRNLSQARKQSTQAQQNQIQKMKQHFKHELQFQAGKTIHFRFRLPISGNSLTRTFKLDQKVKKMFQFINCFGRNQFEDKFAKFDLTQNFPMLSLEDKKQKLISQVFSESERQNIIVRQL